MPKRSSDPLILGVTGHRDVLASSAEEHRERIERLFSTLREQAGAGGLVVLSALAEGADQFVAELALEHDIEIECPLPLPLELYEEDFAVGEARRKFRNLVDRSTLSYVIPECEGHPVEKLRSPGAVRDQMYQAVGTHVVNRSDVLVALWDGVVNGKTGGTANTLAYALRQVRILPLQACILHVERRKQLARYVI